MGSIDYTKLVNLDDGSKTVSFGVEDNKRKFRFAADIFEFVESPDFLGESMFPRQREILERYYFTTDTNGKRLFQELVLISGMRSGKTRMAAWIGAYELHKLLEVFESGVPLNKYFDSRGVKVGIGQRIYIIIVAAALDQAEATIFSQLRGILEYTPWFKRYIKYLKEHKLYSSDKYEIKFHKLIHVKAEDSNSQTLVGKTIHTLLFDEISRLDTSDNEIAKKTQKKSAQMVYQGLSKGTTSFREDRNIIVVSAPVYEDDFGMQMLLQSGELHVCDETRDVILTLANNYPTKVISRLGYHSTTFDFNPYIDRDKDPLVVGTRISSPLVYRRDYLAIPPVGINTYFEDPKKIDLCKVVYDKMLLEEVNYYFDEVIRDGFGHEIKRSYVGKTARNITPNNLVKYVICCDQAARKDSYSLAIGHGEWVLVQDVNSGSVSKKLKVVIDYITSWKPDRDKSVEVSFSNVVSFLAELRSHLNIQCVTFDQWNSVQLIQQMHSLGLPARELSITISMWELLKEKINNGLISFPAQCSDTDLLIQELKKLQLIRGREVDHPSNFSKDLADTVARVCFLVEDYLGGFVASRNFTQTTNYQIFGSSDTIRSVLKNHVIPLMESTELYNSPMGKNGKSFIFTGVSVK
ncbi:MAG: hypothetical protein ABIK31_00385 [candidate division WOR-3 bacterium]